MALNYESGLSESVMTGHTQSGIDYETYGIRNQILANVEHQWSVGIVVSEDAGVDFEGKKIVKAGTPLTGDLDDRVTAFTKATAEAVAVGVLLHDVDVTKGNNNGTLLIFGFVNTNRVDDDVKEMIEATKDSLGMIRFLAC